MNALYLATRRGQLGVGLNDHSSEAEASQRWQYREDTLEDAVERWILRQALERFRRLPVEEDQSGDLFRISVGEDPDVLRT